MFLQYIDFNLSISDEEYEEYSNGLKTFFSYPLKPELVGKIENYYQVLSELEKQQNEKEK